jgi:uncharacterized repeat protein (TIGR03803 family)
MKRSRYFATAAVAVLGAFALTPVMPTLGIAQQFTVVHAFGPAPDAQGPRGALAQGQDGNLYGVTIDGGSFGEGTVFELMGKDVLLIYDQNDAVGGIHCNTGLTVGSDGSFFGTCPGGKPPYDSGTIFNVDSKGVFSTLYSFSGSDGKDPEVGRPVLGADGNYYGVTSEGGANGGGTAFVMTPTGQLSKLADFGGSTGGPSSPSGELIQGPDANFYGTSSSGGKLGGGTVFRMTGTGQVTVLHDFPTKSTTDGVSPMGGVVRAKSGALFGGTFSGGTGNLGTVYELKPTGKEVVLYSFSASDNVSFLCDPLTLAADGALYGTAANSQNDSYGTSVLFKVTTARTFTILHTFDPATEGTKVSGPLLLNTNGTFYGVTETGGTGGGGTLYSLNTGLAPFVSLSPSFGPVGATIGVYGQGFSAKTKVTFAGTPATFTPSGANYGLAIVPAGAATGNVIVRNPGQARMKSLQVFTVTSTAHRASVRHQLLPRHTATKRRSSSRHAETGRPAVR